MQSIKQYGIVLLEAHTATNKYIRKLKNIVSRKAQTAIKKNKMITQKRTEKIIAPCFERRIIWILWN